MTKSIVTPTSILELIEIEEVQSSSDIPPSLANILGTLPYTEQSLFSSHVTRTVASGLGTFSTPLDVWNKPSDGFQLTLLA